MSSYRIIVLKIGSNSLVDEKGWVDQDFLGAIAAQVREAMDQGWTPIIVSSGALACGRTRLAQGSSDSADFEDASLAERQALSAIGQADLMHQWQTALAAEQLFAAQLLVTGEDFHHRQSYLNVRSTLYSLFGMRAVPIINENDPVSAHFLDLGDNDRLSALIASMLYAERLVIATDVDGVYSSDPRSNPDARRLSHVDSISHDLMLASGGAGDRGRGGMRSKMEAAATATQAGVDVHVVGARESKMLTRALADEDIGTHIRADAQAASSRRHWGAMARMPSGTLTVDEGAARALVDKGSSLLAVGITNIKGSFQRGDTVAVVDSRGRGIARGLVGYNDTDLRKIMGKRRPEALEILDRETLPKAVVHRDDLLVTSVVGGTPA